jgi:hypothetical protein
MNVVVKVSKDSSIQDRGVFFRTLKELSKQREAIDRQILKLQGRLCKVVEKRINSQGGDGKKYVARMNNSIILRDAIRDSMVLDVKMTMPEILKALKSKDLYHTRSGYFYTMVNNKLHIDPLIKKVSRGVFILSKSGQKCKAS